MQPDTVATLMERFRKLYATNKILCSFKVQNMGQNLCVKKVPFCKSGHICGGLCCKTVTYMYYHDFDTFKLYTCSDKAVKYCTVIMQKNMSDKNSFTVCINWLSIKIHNFNGGAGLLIL